MNVEFMWYEASPYVYATGGAAAIYSGTRLAQVSGIVLISASLVILLLRLAYRKRQAIKNKTDSSRSETIIRAIRSNDVEIEDIDSANHAFAAEVEATVKQLILASKNQPPEYEAPESKVPDAREIKLP